ALAALSTCLACASWVFVKTERESGSELLPGVPKWTALAIMLAGFGIIALRAVWHASPNWKGRLLAAPAVVIPVLLGFVIPVGTPGILPLALTMLVIVTLLGLPI